MAKISFPYSTTDKFQFGKYQNYTIEEVFCGGGLPTRHFIEIYLMSKKDMIESITIFANPQNNIIEHGINSFSFDILTFNKIQIKCEAIEYDKSLIDIINRVLFITETYPERTDFGSANDLVIDYNNKLRNSIFLFDKELNDQYKICNNLYSANSSLMEQLNITGNYNTDNNYGAQLQAFLKSSKLISKTLVQFIDSQRLHLFSDPEYLYYVIDSVDEFFLNPEELIGLQKLNAIYFHGITLHNSNKELYTYSVNYSLKNNIIPSDIIKTNQEKWETYINTNKIGL